MNNANDQLLNAAILLLGYIGLICFVTALSAAILAEAIRNLLVKPEQASYMPAEATAFIIVVCYFMTISTANLVWFKLSFWIFKPGAISCVILAFVAAAIVIAECSAHGEEKKSGAS